MRYRKFGRTGLNVSELGFGAWGIGQTGWIGADDETSVQTLKLAFDHGINFFDTALAYGDGHSEQLLARTFGNSTEVLIASKVPPKNRIWPAARHTPLQRVFPRSYVHECIDRTLRNLGRETVDLYQFHVWSDHWVSDPEWIRTIEEIRQSGKARFVGISINDHQPGNAILALETGLIDAVQVIYNIFDQSPEEVLLPYCAKHNIGVIVRVPFDEGSLTGAIRPRTTFPAGDFRNAYFAGNRKQLVWDRVQRLVSDIGIQLDQLPEVALRFCVSHPAVSIVIPGMRNPAHLQRNVAALLLGPLSDEMSGKLHKHAWRRNFYALPGLTSRVKERISRLFE